VSAPALYRCTITHVRTEPRRAFRYGSYLWLLDLDRMPRLPWPARLLASFPIADHFGSADAPSIKSNVTGFLARSGIVLDSGRVLMLTGPRVLGYVFNPLTVFWCYRSNGTLAAVLAEVHNTYSERHVYLLRPDSYGRSSADKQFYVSPFLPLAGRYRLRLPEPAERLRLAVTLDVDGTPALIAGVRGIRRPVSLPRLIAYSLRFPWTPLRVALLIRWQAVRLLARRMPVLPRPARTPQQGVQ
jgi:DUF1365 family protein